jgi:hypothetical protein
MAWPLQLHHTCRCQTWITRLVHIRQRELLGLHPLHCATGFSGSIIRSQRYLDTGVVTGSPGDAESSFSIMSLVAVDCCISRGECWIFHSVVRYETVVSSRLQGFLEKCCLSLITATATISEWKGSSHPRNCRYRDRSSATCCVTITVCYDCYACYASRGSTVRYRRAYPDDTRGRVHCFSHDVSKLQSLISLNLTALTFSLGNDFGEATRTANELF